MKVDPSRRRPRAIGRGPGPGRRPAGALAACLMIVAGTLAAVNATGPARPASAQSVPVSFLDSIPLGSDGLCSAQIEPPRPGDGLFDRRYIVVCQDAAAAVGELAVIGDTGEAELLARETAAGLRCAAAAPLSPVAGLADLRRFACTGEDGLLRVLAFGESGAAKYVARGLAVYEDALQLGLASLATNRVVDGRVDIPLTQAADASAFARAQAEAISPQAALAEAYRRSNSGNFAEAAEFFAASAGALEGSGALEARLNAALQQSNLGNHLEAALQFADIREQIGDNPVLLRLARNFEALDALNRGVAAEALTVLDAPLPEGASGLAGLQQSAISEPLANRLAAEQGNAISGATGALTVLERVQLLDAQSRYIRAAALRNAGQRAEARASLLQAQAELLAVRDGRIASILWLRAQILTELAQVAEREGQTGEAEALFTQSVSLLERNYPGSPALVSARAELAGFLARSGRDEAALALYRTLVSDADSKPTAALRRLLAPYFALLARGSDGERAAREMFVASQLLQRPGLAQTQAVLARELSAGSDEASQLFRQSLNIGRGIEQLRTAIAQAELDLLDDDAAAEANLADLRARFVGLQTRQLELQQQLAQYPRYRVVSNDRLTLADLTGALRPGEAYYKLVELDDAAYAIFADGNAASAWRIDAAPADIATMVDLLRDSIAIEQAGQTITYPFEIGLAHELYTQLFGPVDGRLDTVSHLVFEPDGALLRLPANLLVRDAASVERYNARAEDPVGDPYDFRDTAWLGRAMQVTTAVSASGFRDVRATRASDATSAYLGLGNNQPLGEGGFPASTGTRSGGMMSDRCEWAPAVWNNPIQADELRTAETILERSGGSGTLLTGAAFSDTALAQMDQLDEYRILHFATHGLVTAPEPQCPPRPALLTSFGDDGSDGLLGFAEIFDLRLDADLVILSACNTASVGGLVATREAGISGSGDYALDGLVRAFVGAGARTVLASHWPVPDDFNATQRLVTGLFEAGQGVGAGEALRRAQLALMDDADTSHPFYWAAFAVVGDGTVAVVR